VLLTYSNQMTEARVLLTKFLIDKTAATIRKIQKHEKVPNVNFQLTPLLFHTTLTNFWLCLLN